MKKKLLVLAGLSLALTVGTVSCISGKKGPNPSREVAGQFWDDIKIFFNGSEDFSGDKSAQALDTKEIVKRATSGKLNVKEAEILIDNDASFDSKVNMIRSAKKSIRMSYFIYGDDDSSSIITNELIKKAKDGVKVSLLVDFITSYSKLDLFQMMVDEGNGNLDVRFYNFPSIRIQRDAIYMTLPCKDVKNPDSDSCKRDKEAQIAKLGVTKPTFFSSMFLAGLYSKNAVPMKVALGMGAQIDPAKLKGSQETSEEDMARMMEFLKLYFEAKVKNNIGAMIKLTIAMFMYGEELNPVVNQLSGRIPLASETETLPGKKTTHADEWDHLTDYTHHKLLAVDGREFQLGGRNIEDSYHMKSRIPPQPGQQPKGKYIFMDTDFRVVTADGGTAAVERSFDKTFNFREMVADLKEVQRVMPADFFMNNAALGYAAMTCGEQAKSGQLTMSLEACVKKQGLESKQFVSQKDRVAAVKAAMEASVDNYTRNYARSGKKVLRDNIKGKAYTSEVGKLSAKDLETASIYYVENTSFNVKAKEEEMYRRTGSKIGAEKYFNKNIHQLWYKGLENACHVSQTQKKDVRVVLHTAYLFLPSGMLHKIAKMLNGDYGDCSRVHVTLLTNSFATTDLNVINIFARYQMVQLFQRYAGLVSYAEKNKRKAFFPKLDYYEYTAAGAGLGVSLHTKLSLLGDDMIVGSANADARSYAMDTNNAVFIRNAHELNNDYKNFIDVLINDSKRTHAMGDTFAATSPEMLKAENDVILGTMICRWDKTAKNCSGERDARGVLVKPNPMQATKIESERFDQARIAEMLETIDKIGAKVSGTSYKIMNFRSEFNKIPPHAGAQQHNREEIQLEAEMNELANGFDDFFKVL